MKPILKSLITTPAVAALSLLSWSCSSDDLSSAPSRSVTIIAAAGDPAQSRTALNETAYSDGRVGVDWTADDRIGVFSKTGKNLLFTTTETGGRVPFTGSLPSEEAPKYAYYPYSADNDGLNPTDLKGTLPLTQTWTAGGNIDGDYRRGRLRNNSDDEFDFENIFAMLRIRVNATGTSIEGEQLESLTISAPAGRVLGGGFTFDATASGKAADMDGGDGTNTLTLIYAEKPELTSGTSVNAYASCAPGLRTDDDITITLTTSRQKATFTAQAACDFAADCLYTFELTLKTYQDDPKYGFTVESTVEEPQPVDEETANCYMITTAGTHDFCATVIGNGEKGIIKGAGFHTEDPYINPKSAKLLWEDTQGFVTDVKLVDGRVRYTTSTNVGNALIAVCDDSGTILWSWHIWGVGPVLPGDFNLATSGGNTFAMMDRDLGAFPATDEQRLSTSRTEEEEDIVVHAMLYQWGRKDPFPNSATWYVDGNAVTERSVLKPASLDDATIAYAVQNPASVIDLYNTCKVSDWNGNHNDMLWGDDKFSGGSDDGKWTNVKTIYDPSPVGYRVPNYYAFTSFIPNNSTYQQLKGVMSVSKPVDGSPEYPSLAGVLNCVIDTVMEDTTERYLPKGIHPANIGSSVDGKYMHGYGVYMKRFDNDTEGNFFPMTGYLTANGNRSDYGIGAYRWMSCGAVKNTNDTGASFLYYFAWRTASTNTGVNKGLPTGSAGVVGTVRSQYSVQSRYACPIRPVREK